MLGNEGSCDFSPYVPSWSYDDTSGDFNLSDFSIENDVQRRFPLLKDAVARRRSTGADLKLFGSPWSAPGILPNILSFCGRYEVVFGCCRLDENQRRHDL